jgi:glycosyltransferase involved in cell wall biosynthesis
MLNTPNGPQPSQPNMFYKVSEPKFDIIHTQHKPITERVLKLYPNIPKLATIHSEVISLEDPIQDSSIVRYVAIRPEIKQKINVVDGINEDLIDVVYNPIDENRFNTTNTKDHNYILFVGTIDYLRKNSIYDICSYAKEQNKELWLVGENKSDYLEDLLKNTHVKYYPSTNQVEKFVNNCSETAGILLGRTTIEGWMCGKQGWIYDVDDEGQIKNKSLKSPPEDIIKFHSIEVAKKIKETYIKILKEW